MVHKRRILELNSLLWLWQSDQLELTKPLLHHWFNRTNVQPLNLLTLTEQNMIITLNILLRPEHMNELLSVTLRRSSRYPTIFCFFVFVPSSFVEQYSSVWFSITDCLSCLVELSDSAWLHYALQYPPIWLIEFDKQICKDNSTDYEEKAITKDSK